MGLFDFLRKFANPTAGDGNQNNSKGKERIKIIFTETINGKTSTVSAQNTEDDDELFPTDFEHLTKNGDLPFGWLSRNKEFTEKINNEYLYFWKMWLETRDKSPKELYPALKSFVLYLEDAEKLCKSKGECFELWFYELIASKEYIAKLKGELDELTANFDTLQKDYENKLLKEEKIKTMKPDVICLLKENDGILQSDFWKLFDDEICKAAASDIVYALLKEGKIERTKSGRSYILHYKE